MVAELAELCIKQRWTAENVSVQLTKYISGRPAPALCGHNSIAVGGPLIISIDGKVPGMFAGIHTEWPEPGIASMSIDGTISGANGKLGTSVQRCRRTCLGLQSPLTTK